MSLCPEAARRDRMTDAEFWEWVFHRGDTPDTDDSYDEHDPALFGTMSPCPECGELGACAYDNEGRPLIHAVTTDADA